ncbi:hypothetical protein IJJ37_02000 [Candidatus Saccharibacteria bacterium]|nr:hypothetical protein [Candidatus Saccharibacteria bacterium]
MEPQNTTPENNLNTPPVGPMPEPLPPEPTPPAPVVPETPQAKSKPAPSATPEAPKKESNPNRNNYILAGVSIGAVAIAIALVCGAIFGGWFGDSVGGFIFGEISQPSSGSTGSSNTIIEKPVVESYTDTLNLVLAQTLQSALIMYQTNNRGQLPTIDGTSEFVSAYSDTETPIENFYANYLGDDFVDEFGLKPDIWFYDSYSDFIASYGDEGEDALNYNAQLTVVYHAACNNRGIPEVSSNARDFVITIGRPSLNDHYCIDSSN